MLERWLPAHKSIYNLSGACVKPLRLNELINELNLDVAIEYGYTKGDDELRAKVASLFPHADRDDVLITIGTAEANFLALNHLLDRGDEVVTFTPTYKGSIGVAEAIGATVTSLPLSVDDDYAVNVDALQDLVTHNTRAILITNPNNPTASKYTPAEVRAICEIAEDADAYVVCDEALRGLELDGAISPSPGTFYEKCVSTGSLSKLGLPGLRIGWMVAERAVVDACWSYRDYTTLGIPVLSEHLATIALDHLDHLMRRARTLLKDNLHRLHAWARTHREVLHLDPVRAGATAFPRYRMNVTSVTLCTALLRAEGVLLTPGQFFDAPRRVRMRYGGVAGDTLQDALSRITRFLRDTTTDAHTPSGEGTV
jgi:aspartate/methionine/tyrosine aminotransferase